MEKFTVTPKLKYYKNGYKRLSKQSSTELTVLADYRDKFGIDIPDYEVNLFRVHYEIWKDFLEHSTKEYCLIQEYNTILLEDLEEIKIILKAENTNFHVLFPFDLINSTERPKLPIAFSRFGFFWGTSSYIISKKTVKELIEYCSEISWPLAEQFLELAIAKKIKLITVDTNWTVFSDCRSLSYQARKESIIQHIGSYSAWEQNEIIEVRQILLYLSKIAASLDIKIFLHAGTLLGSVRHWGKIMPWDDDIDLMVEKEDLERLITSIREDGLYQVTEWVWSKTGKTYYKIWKGGGYKAEGYEYTFPFVDIWWTEEIDGMIHTNDGHVFEKKTYFPLHPVKFENALFYHPAVPYDILDLKYKGWREEIRLFSWSHKYKKHSVKQTTVPIITDKLGRFTNYK